MNTPFQDVNREAALDKAAELIRRTWSSFDQARPDQPGIAEHVEQLLAMPLPETGLDSLTVLGEVDHILDQSISQPRPRFFAYVGSSGLEMGVLADALAASHDINLAVYAGAASYVEKVALAWLSDLVGFGSPHGAFTSGGMLSNLTALTAARQRALPDSRETGVRQDVSIYISQDAHSSVERAVEILGIGNRSIRDVSIDGDRRMIPAELEKMIEADLAAGVTPIAIIASAGTTLSGAVDPLNEIADIAEKHGVWLHVDGAYGGPAAATEIVAPLFDGLTRVDSFTIDAHKWLFLPKPCGVVLVRDQKTLLAAFTHDASYILDEPDFINPVEWTLEYSRPLRALKVWLALRTYGASQFREAITRNIKQARLCADLVKAAPALELLQTPQLSTVLFRRLPQSGDVNTHNRDLARAIQTDGRFYVAAARVDGVDCLRVCFVNYRTVDDDVRALVEIVEELGNAISE